MALKFLMSTCRYCGAPAKGKHYRTLVVLTPFALIFYSIIFLAFFYVGMTSPEYDNAVGRIAVFLSVLAFLVPGLLILFLLKRSKGVCDLCLNRDGNVLREPSRKPQPVAVPLRSVAEREPRSQPDHSEREAIEELMNNNPSAREIIDRNSAHMPALTTAIVQKVVQATVHEWANNIDEAAKLYEEVGLRDEAIRVGSKNTINKNTGIKGLERIG